MRIKVIRIIIIGLFLIIALDLIYVQVIRGRYFYHLSTNNRIRIVPLEGWRGKIKDRNGNILADSRVAYNVMVAPQDIGDRQKIFQFLSKVLEIDQEIIEKRYLRKKLAPFAPVTVAENISRDKAIVLEEGKYRYPSLIIQEGFKRSYPLKKNSAHILGHVGKVNRAKRERLKEYGYSPQSIIGYEGVEEYYDAYLKGGEGGIQIEVNSRGQQVRLLSFKEPTKGQDITLAINSDIQQIAMDLLEGATGAIVVMDMSNGEILGMTSSPAYDPNVFVDVKKQKRLPSLFSNTRAPFLNRAIRGLFPPGSVFKITVAIGALDSRKITEHTSYNCKGYYKLGGRKFRCAHTHGLQNLIQSIAHSCNVYYYHVGSLLGVEGLYRYARKFGLGLLTYIDLPYEKSGFIPNRRHRFQRGKRQWYAGDILNYSVGQGDVLVTPLQLVRMIATIANDGMEVQPHIVQSIGGMPVKQYNFKRKIKIDEQALKTVQKGLRAAVTDYSGTASILNFEELYVAGKTGTAQASGEKGDHAWFVGYVKNYKFKRMEKFCSEKKQKEDNQQNTKVSQILPISFKHSKENPF